MERRVLPYKYKRPTFKCLQPGSNVRSSASWQNKGREVCLVINTKRNELTKKMTQIDDLMITFQLLEETAKHLCSASHLATK